MTIREEMNELYPDILIMDGYDDALIGVGERCGSEPIAVYDTDKIIKINMSQGMTEEEALEYFDFNQLGAYVGTGTPMFIHRVDYDTEV